MKKLIIYTVLLTGMVTQSGCEKYLDRNTNPNLVYNPPINSLLVNTTYQTALNTFRMGNITSYYMQYLASPNVGSDRDIYKEEDLSGTWNSHYAVMMDIRQLQAQAIQRGATEHLGVSKVLMAWNLNMLINMFGDVPFTQALMGKENLKPGYDNQQALHDTTIRLLNEAIVEFNKPVPTIRLDAGSDLIHKGNLAAWKKTAHALKARFLNQLSERTDKYSPTEIFAALANAYTSNTDNAALTTFQGNNPWNQVARNNANLLLDGWLSEQFVDALDGTSYGFLDPRLPLITNLTRFGDYRGTPNGQGRSGTGTTNDESVLTRSGFYSKDGSTTPLWLVTYAEMKFIEAEAAFRSNDKPRAYTAYLAAIKAHMDMMNVAPAARDAYLANPAVAVGSAALTLDLIFKEKYVAMFLHPESWVDARRFDYAYKDFTLPVNAALSSFIRRSAYPVVETARNGANVPAVTLLTKLWWDM
jgi:hypothetical protein